MKRKLFLRSYGWVFFILFSACAPVIQPANSGPTAVPFRPPTPVGFAVGVNGEASQAMEANNAEKGEQRPTPTVECQNNLTFLSDITIPDGAVVAAEATLDKRWEVQNSGNCNWDEDYRVRLIAGPELGAQREQALFPARSNSRATIRIVFKAPVEPGNYRSAWQAFNPQGEPFGDPFFIEINVQ